MQMFTYVGSLNLGIPACWVLKCKDSTHSSLSLSLSLSLSETSTNFDEHKLCANTYFEGPCIYPPHPLSLSRSLSLYICICIHPHKSERMYEVLSTEKTCMSLVYRYLYTCIYMHAHTRTHTPEHIYKVLSAVKTCTSLVYRYVHTCIYTHAHTHTPEHTYEVFLFTRCC